MIEFIENRLAQMLARPEIWGRGESLELQILLLVEMHRIASGQILTGIDPVDVCTSYRGFCRGYGYKGVFMPSGWADSTGQPPSLLLEMLRAWVESELPGFVLNRLG